MQRGRTRVRRPPEERRAQILEEAVSLVGETGFYGFSIRTLAIRCGITVAGVLHYFRSKTVLLAALLDTCERRDAARLGSERSTPRELCAYEQALDFCRAIVRSSVTQPEFVRLFAVLGAEALHRHHPAHDYFVRREAATIERLARVVEPHVCAPQSTALQLLSLMKGLELEWLRSGQTLDILGEWEIGLAHFLPRRPETVQSTLQASGFPVIQ